MGVQLGKEVNDEPPEGYFGIGSSPLVEGDKVLVRLRRRCSWQAGIVALAADTGRTVWKATAERASYSSRWRWSHRGGVCHVDLRYAAERRSPSSA